MYGVGHGGIEAILVGILSIVTLIQIMALQGVDLSTVVEPDQIEVAQAQIEAFWSAPWYLVLLGTIERVIAITFHVSATVLVLQSFRRKNLIWLFYAIGLHTLLNAAEVFANQTWGPYIAEGILFVIGLLCLWIVFRLKTTDEPLGLDSSGGMPIPPEIQPVSPSEENLEDSRYV
jgi:uncharacterized membrane protein YhfC